MGSGLDLWWNKEIAREPGAALEHPMSASMLGYGLALYAATGIGVGLAFVTIGAGRVLPGTSFTGGARFIIFPGAAVLWPYVLLRWLRSHSASKTRVNTPAGWP
jgi:hypothetical protein